MKKPCDKCKELFTHRSSAHKLCNKCNPTAAADWIVEAAKLSKKVAKREKMKKRLKVTSNAKKVLAKKETKGKGL